MNFIAEEGQNPLRQEYFGTSWYRILLNGINSSLFLRMLFFSSPLAAVFGSAMLYLFLIDAGIKLIYGGAMGTPDCPDQKLDATIALVLTSINLVIWLALMSTPWGLVAAYASSAALQTYHFIKNLYCGLKAPKGSQERAHYLQAVIANTFNLVMIALTTALVVMVLLSPVGPAVLLPIVVVAATLTATSLIWCIIKGCAPTWIERLSMRWD